MQKQIIRTLELGNATMEITMDCSSRMSDLDGYRFETKDIEKSVSAKIIANGNVVMTSTEGFIYGVDSEKGRFGDKYIKASTVASALTIIKEMYAEVEEELAVKTTVEIVVEKEIIAAKKVMAEVETRKTEILSNKDEIRWATNYNNINNEGGEGYIPTRVTLEDIACAKKILNIN
jgi:hypothetical protein